MISSILKHLNDGGVIVHPTDTVFAISSLASSSAGYKKIYELKKRDFNKPLGVLLKEINDIENFTSLPMEEVKKMQTFLESGGTLLLPIHSNLPKHLLDQSDFIGVRIPNHKQTKELIEHLGPLIATSANISGEPPITNAKEAISLFPDCMILDGTLGSNTPSTILKYSPEGYSILRS